MCSKLDSHIDTKLTDIHSKIDNVNVSDMYQQKINDIKQSLDDNFKRDELVKQLVEDHRLQMVELRRSIDENNRHDADIEGIVKKCVSQLDMLVDLKARSDELKKAADKIQLIDSIRNHHDELSYNVSRINTTIEKMQKSGGGSIHMDELRSNFENLFNQFNENKRITDERIEKLVKLFLSLNK